MMFIELVTRFFGLFSATHHSSSLMNKVSVECPRIQSSSSFWIRWHVAKRSCHSLETQEIPSQSGKYGNSMKWPLCELHNSSKHMMKTCVAHPISSCYEHLACLLRRWQILASPFLPQNYLCEEQFVPLKSIDWNWPIASAHLQGKKRRSGSIKGLVNSKHGEDIPTRNCPCRNVFYVGINTLEPMDVHPTIFTFLSS